VAKVEVSTTVHVVVEVLGRTNEEVPVPSTTVSQIQALGAAKLRAAVLDMVLNGTSNGGLLSCSVAVSTLGLLCISMLPFGLGQLGLQTLYLYLTSPLGPA
jgi:hypothetical protein